MMPQDLYNPGQGGRDQSETKKIGADTELVNLQKMWHPNPSKQGGE